VESPFEFDLTGAISSIARTASGGGHRLVCGGYPRLGLPEVKENDLERTVLVLSQAGHQTDR
jgi:hypothetical protein